MRGATGDQPGLGLSGRGALTPALLGGPGGAPARALPCPSSQKAPGGELHTSCPPTGTSLPVLGLLPSPREPLLGSATLLEQAAAHWWQSHRWQSCLWGILCRQSHQRCQSSSSSTFGAIRLCPDVPRCARGGGQLGALSCPGHSFAPAGSACSLGWLGRFRRSAESLSEQQLGDAAAPRLCRH